MLFNIINERRTESAEFDPLHIGMSLKKSDWNENKNHSENLITRTKRNEPTIRTICFQFEYTHRQTHTQRKREKERMNIGVSGEERSVQLIHASSFEKRTHTQFTQFKLHFQQFGILFYFILILFCRCHKIVVIIFFPRLRFLSSIFCALFRIPENSFSFLSLYDDFLFPFGLLILFCVCGIEILSSAPT